MFDPKTQQKLNDYSYLKTQTQNMGKYGIIQSYDAPSNTATVLLSASDSDMVGDIMTDVPCPTLMGIQMAAPEPGRPCWVAFRSGQNDRRAVISHYFNHKFHTYDYAKQYNAASGIPRYQLGL